MSTQEPKPEDFGVTPQQYLLYVGYRVKFWDRTDNIIPFIFGGIGFTVTFSAIFFMVDQDAELASRVLAGFFIGLFASPFGCMVGLGAVHVVDSTIKGFKRSRLLKSPVASQIKLYQEVMIAYLIAEEEEAERRQMQQQAEIRLREETERKRQQAEQARLEALRKREEYWNGLSGLEFERELGNLCKRRGYKVSFTPVSGDEGIDLILRKNGKTTVVQCKSHKSSVGPAVVRELYGSMVAFRADNAILACTGGFTKGAKEFAHGKPITLVDASDLARMSEIIGGNADIAQTSLSPEQKA